MEKYKAHRNDKRRVLFLLELVLTLFVSLFPVKISEAKISLKTETAYASSVSTGGGITETPPVQTETPPAQIETPAPVESMQPPEVSAPPVDPNTLTGKWGKENGKKYYQYSDGSYAHGVVKIKKSIYAFSVSDDVTEPGFLLQGKKTRIYKLNGKMYLVGKNGKIIKGWYQKNNKLYYFHGKLGCAVTDKRVGKIKFNHSGYAVNDPNSAVKIRAMKILDAITSPGDSKSQKLHKAFQYMVKKSRWKYAMKYPNMHDKLWTRKLGSNMLKTHSGNCYGFACGFAALAEEIGYHPQVICGRIPGTRDRSRDGLTRHAVVRISGKYYDPEGCWKGFSHVYNRKSCPLTQVKKVVRF